MVKSISLLLLLVLVLVSGQEFSFDTSDPNTQSSQIDSSLNTFGTIIKFSRETRIESIGAYVKFIGGGNDVGASVYIQNYNESDSSESFVFESAMQTISACDTPGCSAWVSLQSLNATINPGTYCVAVRLDRDYFSVGVSQNTTNKSLGIVAYGNYMNFGCVFNNTDTFSRTYLANSEKNFAYRINGYSSFNQCAFDNGGCAAGATCYDPSRLSDDSVVCTCAESSECGAPAAKNKPSYGNGDPGLSIGVPIAIIIGILAFTAVAYVIYWKAWKNWGKNNNGNVTPAKSPNNLEMQPKEGESVKE